ncbi:hypothetical protein [Tahibacter amnicola]|uniref:Uncharacterized protein n=1 Tax=Tahibacter amnicola TaxID=2976241 RepID=A0ABY6BL70_9GAMM|nr:hypothetical protein [Tahibacter amnicola]UXI70532.1 hypothetical protein N4264_13100 [Tahibacter amnicola]
MIAVDSIDTPPARAWKVTTFERPADVSDVVALGSANGAVIGRGRLWPDTTEAMDDTAVTWERSGIGAVVTCGGQWVAFGGLRRGVIAGAVRAAAGGLRAARWSHLTGGTREPQYLAAHRYLHSMAWGTDGQHCCGVGTNGMHTPVQPIVWEPNGDLRELRTGGLSQVTPRAVHGTRVAGTGQQGRRTHAVYWPDLASAPTLLSAEASCCNAMSGELQAGAIFSGARSRPVLWRGEPRSLVELLPAAFDGGMVNACDGIFQAGSCFRPAEWWPDELPHTDEHAFLWMGTAGTAIDLHRHLPAPWNSSVAMGVEIVDGGLRVYGKAMQYVPDADLGAPVEANECAVVWELCPKPRFPRPRDTQSHGLLAVM